MSTQTAGEFYKPFGKPETPNCKHTDKDLCQCECHAATDYGEPVIIHMIACCESCPVCSRNVDKQLDGFTS